MESEWVAVAAAADVPEGRPFRAVVGDEEILLFRQGDRVLAVGNRCTHMGASLARGRVRRLGSTATVTCVAHGSVFDLSSGRVMRGPATRPVKAYDARVRAELVEVRER